MKIKIVDFVEGARKAEGAVIVIDVFRAFSVACYAFAGGASKIIPVGAISEARRMKKEMPDCILIGERGGKMVDGFNFGNSPTEIQNVDFYGKTLVHTTHAGTQGLVNAIHGDAVLTGAFVNASATARYVQSLSPEVVTLVRMGWEAKECSDEDDLCAAYLQSLLMNTPFNIEEIRKTLRKSPFSERFFDPEKPWSPPTDFDLCLDVNRFDFAIQAVKGEDNYLFLRKVIL